MPTDIRDIGHLLNQIQLELLFVNVLCAAREGFYIAAGPAVSIRVMMDLDTLCTTSKNSVDVPVVLPIDFHLHLLVDKGEQKKREKEKKTLWVVALPWLCVMLLFIDASSLLL
jgi:hypothetical protein